ncbi:MAG: hypothetical protein ACJATI_004654 [Halioglobus sp.]|jgi:hypothetical protein
MLEFETSEGWLYIVVRVLPEQDWAYVLKDNEELAWYPIDWKCNLILLNRAFRYSV